MAYLETAPTLREIAERLSVIQRWNGRTTIPWSVLQHTILAAALLDKETTTSYMRLTVLMHDAAEGWIGDIPRPFKCPEQAELEQNILGEIYDGLNLVVPWTLFVKKELRYIDDVAAVVEAQCICHPAERRNVVSRHLEVNPPDTALVEKGENILWNMRDLPRVEAIEFWIKAVEDAIHSEGGVT